MLLIALVWVAEGPAKEKRPELRERPNSVFWANRVDNDNKPGRSSGIFLISEDLVKSVTTCLDKTLSQHVEKSLG